MAAMVQAAEKARGEARIQPAAFQVVAKGQRGGAFQFWRRAVHGVNGVCDLCGGELGIRKDDAPETVLDRLRIYHKETEPLKAFYAQRGKLLTVENQASIEATTAAVRRALEH